MKIKPIFKEGEIVRHVLSRDKEYLITHVFNTCFFVARYAYNVKWFNQKKQQFESEVFSENELRKIK